MVPQLFLSKIFGGFNENFHIYFDENNLPKVFEKRGSTDDWEVVQGHVLQKRTAVTGRLKRRRGGERGPCKFPENKNLVFISKNEQKCKNPSEEF